MIFPGRRDRNVNALDIEQVRRAVPLANGEAIERVWGPMPHSSGQDAYLVATTQRVVTLSPPAGFSRSVRVVSQYKLDEIRSLAVVQSSERTVVSVNDDSFTIGEERSVDDLVTEHALSDVAVRETLSHLRLAYLTNFAPLVFGAGSQRIRVAREVARAAQLRAGETPVFVSEELTLIDGPAVKLGLLMVTDQRCLFIETVERSPDGSDEFSERDNGDWRVARAADLGDLASARIDGALVQYDDFVYVQSNETVDGYSSPFTDSDRLEEIIAFQQRKWRLASERTASAASATPPPAPPPAAVSGASGAAGGFCPYCGAATLGGYRFCRACGKKLEA